MDRLHRALQRAPQLNGTPYLEATLQYVTSKRIFANRRHCLPELLEGGLPLTEDNLA